MYDLIVIGAGWAGFNAALRAKELGLKVCLVDKANLGGVCLNQGCIPTKALIQSAKIYSSIKKSSDFGIDSRLEQIDFSKIQERKDRIIQQLTQGIKFRLKEVDFIEGDAIILSTTEVKVGDKVLKTKFMLIAVGSRPIELNNLKFGGKVISSNEIINLKDAPKSLLIIGGGVIGCEFAGLFSSFGSEVTIVEKMQQLLPGEDKEIARKIETLFKKRGIKVNTNTDATALDMGVYDLVLLSIGRAPNIGNLGLDKLGVNLEKGKILVNEYLRTNIPNIFAAGDCTGKMMLAHYASYQAILAVENIASGQDTVKADNLNIPSCIFTEPEISSVGINEEKAKEKGIDIKVYKFDFLGSGMARILGETEGFIKIISDQANSQIIGASIIGPKAVELIGIFTVAVTSQLKVSQLKNIVFAHPTLSEAIGDALRTKS